MERPSPILPGLVLGRPATSSPREMGFSIPRPKITAAQGDDVLTQDGEGHSLVVGHTGAGKSAGILIPTLLSYPGATVVVDVKGELAAATAEHRRQFGPVHIVDPFSVVRAAPSRDRLNPLDLTEIVDRFEILDLAREISGLITVPHASLDPYWDEAAKGMISRIAALLAGHLPPCPARSISSVSRLLRLTGQDLGQLLAYAWMSPVAPGDMEALVRAYDLAPQTLSCVLSHSESLLAPVVSPAADRALCGTTVDLRRLIAGLPLTIYLVLPPERLHSHVALLRTWLGLIMQLLFRRRSQPRQDTLILIDEAAQIGRLDILPTLYTLGRGVGIRAATFWQDLDQLRALYPEHAGTILQNSAAILQLGTEPHHAHERLTTFLGRPLTGRSSTSTVHLPGQRRAVPVAVPLHFADPLFMGLASKSAQPSFSHPLPSEQRRHGFKFDRRRSLRPPGDPSMPEARTWHQAMRKELNKYADDQSKLSADSGFRALLGRLLGPELLNDAI